MGAFSDDVDFSGEFTSDQPHLVRALNDLPFGDGTRLYDAIDASIVKLRAVEGRKVLLVFTDGEDTASHVTFRRVLDRARNDDVLVAGIRLVSDFDHLRKHPRDDRPLKTLAEETGGGYFELSTNEELAPTFARVERELHSKYILGFSPSTLDGKTHELIVHVRQPTMSVRARRSYTGSPELIAGAGEHCVGAIR